MRRALGLIALAAPLLLFALIPLGRLVFYNGPKTLVWIFALTTLTLWSLGQAIVVSTPS